MPNRRLPPGEIDPAFIEGARPFSGMKMRIPADARMSENIEDRRGDAAMYGGKLSLQKTRGQRMDSNREFFTPKEPVSQLERDIDETVKTTRMNAGAVQPGMSPREEREALDTGSSSGYEVRRKRQDLDELMERISREQRSTGKDTRGFEDLIENETRGFAKGGMVRKTGPKSAAKKGRGDGICIKGHTKGRMY